MSLYQCGNCGCCENTALGAVTAAYAQRFFNYEGIEDRAGMLLCSACGPTHYLDGSPTSFGKWHGRFERVYLPEGEFKTNSVGNLEHIRTGRQDFRSFALSC